MMTRSRAAFRWFFEDRRSGRIVVAQMPNAALWIALAALLLGYLFTVGKIATATRIVLFVALAAWAIDEAARGVNPWRRILGIGTLVGMAIWLVVLKR